MQASLIYQKAFPIALFWRPYICPERTATKEEYVNILIISNLSSVTIHSDEIRNDGIIFPFL